MAVSQNRMFQAWDVKRISDFLELQWLYFKLKCNYSGPGHKHRAVFAKVKKKNDARTNNTLSRQY